MKLVQVRDREMGLQVGVVFDGDVFDLTLVDPARAASIMTLVRASGDAPLWSLVQDLVSGLEDRPRWRYEDIDREPGPAPYLLAPVDAPEVWGAGLTYERSRDAREAESEGHSQYYTDAYEAARPELFIKTSNMLRVAGPHGPIGIRRDSKWTVPEPELAVVLGAGVEIVGYTLCNDVTARDIEAENPLYLPQAKSFHGGCALGPALVLAEEGLDPRLWTIEMRIISGTELVFAGEVAVGRMRRSFEDLVAYLCRDNEILPGTVLMTGTGIVPGDDFYLRGGDVIEISVEAIGTLRNSAIELQ